MPYTKEQLRTYWEVNKERLNEKRRERRRLARLATVNKLVNEEVNHLNPKEAEVNQAKANQNRPKATSYEQVSHHLSTKRKQVSQKTSDLMTNLANLKTANPQLNSLFNQWLTQTNYACSLTCTYSYCNNCWFFIDNKLVDYKHVISP